MPKQVVYQSVLYG